MKPEPCPQCGKLPETWKEQPQYGSRELVWLGCKEHGHLAGGVSSFVALANWNRYIHGIAA